MAASVFFVWVVRYANIFQEFKQYGLPDWLWQLASADAAEISPKASRSHLNI